MSASTGASASAQSGATRPLSTSPDSALTAVSVACAAVLVRSGRRTGACSVAVTPLYMERFAHALPEVRQHLVVDEGAAEEVTVLLEAVEGGADGPPVRAQVGVLQLVPADRHAHRSARCRTGGGRRDERLVDRVLRVVQARPALAVLLLPLPADQVRHEPADGPRHLLHPGPGLVERRARSDRDPDLQPAAPGDLDQAAHVEPSEGGPVQSGEG